MNIGDLHFYLIGCGCEFVSLDGYDENSNQFKHTIYRRGDKYVTIPKNEDLHSDFISFVCAWMGIPPYGANEFISDTSAPLFVKEKSAKFQNESLPAEEGAV